MASGKVIFEKILGLGVDAEVPSWNEFSALRRKLGELQQVVNAENSKLESSLASTDRHLNDVIDSHNELDGTTGQLREQISRLEEAQESLKQYRERIAQNIEREISPLIEGQINRFYSVAKEIESYATSTKEWMTQVSEDLHNKHQTLADEVKTIQTDASRVADSIGTLKNEATTAQTKFRQFAEDAMLAQSKQQNSIVEGIIEEAKRQTTSCVDTLDSQCNALMEKVAACSQLFDDARIEAERAQSLFQADASRVADSIGTLKNEATTAQSKFRQSVEDAMLAQSNQQNSIVEGIIEEAKRQTTSCVDTLDSQCNALMERVAAYSQRFDDAKIEAERAQSLLSALQSEPTRHLGILNIAQELNHRSWKSFWKRLVWLFLGASQ